MTATHHGLPRAATRNRIDRACFGKAVVWADGGQLKVTLDGKHIHDLGQQAGPGGKPAGQGLTVNSEPIKLGRALLKEMGVRPDELSVLEGDAAGLMATVKTERLVLALGADRVARDLGLGVDHTVDLRQSLARD